MTTLIQRLQEADMAGLSDAQAAAALNEPDPLLPPVPVAFSCRNIADTAVLSGELALLRIVAARGEIPADIAGENVAVPLPTQAIAVIMTMLDAVDRDLGADPTVVEDRVVVMLDNVETMGLLSPATKAAILAKTFRSPSWAEMSGVTVTADTVAIARAGLQAVTVLQWLSIGPAPGGSYHEQVRLLLAGGSEVAPIFKLPMNANSTLRAAALNSWMIANGNIFS